MNSAEIVIQTFALLLGMSVLAIVVVWFARRAGVGAARGPIRLLGQLPLEPRRSVYLIEVGAQVLVVGVGEGGMHKLGELPRSELPEAPPRPASPSWTSGFPLFRGPAQVMAKQRSFLETFQNVQSTPRHPTEAASATEEQAAEPLTSSGEHGAPSQPSEPPR